MINAGQKNGLFWSAMVIAALVFLYLIRPILLPFVLGMATAYFLDPAADRLERLKLSRTLATFIITAFFFSAITLLCIIGLPLIGQQLGSLMSQLPDYLNRVNTEFVPLIEQKLYGLSPDITQHVKSSIASSTGMIAQATTDFLGRLLTSGIAFLNLLSLVLITPVVAFYLLRDWDKVVSHIDDLLPRKHAQTIREQCQIINQTLAAFVRGQLNVCLLLGLYYACGLSLVGLHSGFVIGLMTGFLVIFPYVGLIVGMLIGLTVAYFQFDTLTPILSVLMVFVSGQIIEGNFVTPKLVGDKVGLHPVWVIFAMLAGGVLLGFVGVLLAVPLAAVLGVLIRFAIGRYRVSNYYN